MIAIFGEDLNTAELLIRAGADINATDNTGRSAAHHAATLYKGLTVIEWLLANGSDFKLRDNDGLTPACIAKNKRKEDIIDALEANGVNYQDCGNH